MSSHQLSGLPLKSACSLTLASLLDALQDLSIEWIYSIFFLKEWKYGIYSNLLKGPVCWYSFSFIFQINNKMLNMWIFEGGHN